MCSLKTMLCLALLIASAVTTVSADTGKFSSCCTRVSSAKPKIHLENFLLQKADPPCVEAVMFITKEGKILCSRPNLPWVKQRMMEIRLRKEALQNNTATE
ncbi:C-C motif chemokine 24-like [Pseudophryne corroboree]|uniref:C-C motif chemokine 24-like n=1 Tax=Pseudophryne corroboree TaxID=495146 RepID=UPI0030817ED3